MPLCHLDPLMSDISTWYQSYTSEDTNKSSLADKRRVKPCSTTSLIESQIVLSFSLRHVIRHCVATQDSRFWMQDDNREACPLMEANAIVTYEV